MWFISPLERCLPGPGNFTTIGVMYVSLEALLYILTQPCINRQLRWLWSFSEPFGLPLRDRSTIFETTTTGRRIAREFARDG
jgi:hypothetical protein